MKNALRAALEERGYDTLTPVQQAVMAPELQGRDLLVSAQTGSGKTLGFGLAISSGLLGEGEAFERADTPLALIIAPTRELAMQVKRELGWLYAKAGAVVASCVGGMDMRDERRSLARGAHIVVATPGRLRDHIMRESIDLSALRAVVLDEADEMLDLGFREDLEFILGEAPAERQTLLFSATVPPSIAELAKSYQRDAERVVTKAETKQHADITYRAMMVAERDTEHAVINTLRYYESPNAIVFANTRAMVNRLTTRLSNRGFQVVALSGELTQSERSNALQAMRDGRAQVCVATDVAARGIDLPNLDLVVHAELPKSHETLLHRSGRTGRAGRKGVSALIVTHRSKRKAQRILSMAKLQADWCAPPSADEVKTRDLERMFADPAWQDPIDESEREMVANLVEGFTPEQLAAAYLRLFGSLRSAPEELADAEAAPAPRKEFGPSIWFAIPGGRAAEAEPRRLLPMLCRAGNLSKDDIGAIRVQQDQSFVQILETSVARFVEALGPEMALEDVKLTQLAEAPVLERPERPRGPRPGGKPGHRGKREGGRPDRGDRDGPRPSRKEYGGDRPQAPRHDDRKTAWKDSPSKPPREKPAPKRDYADAKPAYKGKSDDKAKSEGKGPSDYKGKSDYKSDYKAKPRGRDGDGADKSWSKPSFGKGKPGDKPAGKPYGKSGSEGRGAPYKPGKPGKGGGEPPRRSGAGPDRGGKPMGKPMGKPGGKPKGPPPPVGKPSSKKNKARAMAHDTGKRLSPPRKPRGKG
ncbi:MAG: DEAD/DEAH box helicase [Pelagimonas sp.]|nr:DEAD/DEAH box helicase [Pelagimonas sp.]